MHRVAQELFSKIGFTEEPMPNFESRYPGRLESCLKQPFGSYAGVIYYRGTLKKALALFYFCIKNHPFENGNKRFAVTIMLYFLITNDYWLDVSPEFLYDVAKALAESDESPKEAINKMHEAFKPHLEKL